MRFKVIAASRRKVVAPRQLFLQPVFSEPGGDLGRHIGRTEVFSKQRLSQKSVSFSDHVVRPVPQKPVFFQSGITRTIIPSSPKTPLSQKSVSVPDFSTFERGRPAKRQNEDELPVLSGETSKPLKKSRSFSSGEEMVIEPVQEKEKKPADRITIGISPVDISLKGFPSMGIPPVSYIEPFDDQDAEGEGEKEDDEMMFLAAQMESDLKFSRMTSEDYHAWLEAREVQRPSAPFEKLCENKTISTVGAYETRPGGD